MLTFILGLLIWNRSTQEVLTAVVRSPYLCFYELATWTIMFNITVINDKGIYTVINNLCRTYFTFVHSINNIFVDCYHLFSSTLSIFMGFGCKSRVGRVCWWSLPLPAARNVISFNSNYKGCRGQKFISEWLVCLLPKRLMTFLPAFKFIPFLF